MRVPEVIYAVPRFPSHVPLGHSLRLVRVLANVVGMCQADLQMVVRHATCSQTVLGRMAEHVDQVELDRGRDCWALEWARVGELDHAGQLEEDLAICGPSLESAFADVADHAEQNLEYQEGYCSVSEWEYAAARVAQMARPQKLQDKTTVHAISLGVG